MPEQAADDSTKQAEKPTADVKTEKEAEVEVKEEKVEAAEEKKTATVETSKEETTEDPVKTEKKSAEDPQSKETLVITEEDLDNLQLDDNDDNKITVTKEEIEPKKKPAQPDRSANIWVSNISRITRANDLKQLFKKAGNVIKVRIVTNGQCYYGLVMMENAELAMECVQKFNNTMFKGKKIVVSKTRPDLLTPKEFRKKQMEATVAKKKEEAKPKTEEKPNATEATEDAPPPKKNEDDEQARKLKSLKQKYETAVTDISKLKRDLRSSESRCNGMRARCKDLERQVERLRNENRTERRRLAQEKEEFEKSKKLHEIRMSADKAVVDKELSEVRRLRQHLNEKIDEFRLTSKKSSVGKRSRSPPSRRMEDPKRYRPDRDEKMRSSRDDYQRGRTPPPPPKLSDRKSNGRYHDYDDIKTRSSDRPFDSFRDKQPYPSGPSMAPRGVWPMSSMQHQKDAPRRPMGGPGGAPGTVGYPPMDTGRYGAYLPIPGVGNPGGPPRGNFGGSQDYGKPYGGHY
ncbi:unnamed protein product [Acanthoscelides obtectus]|uniref:RRM domain-containing protein n=1 Tax=Acanthoscelides obtectus TaxID=200917 RepID=A0A9P0JZJ8_ACAOB|nr:unnamed protein product [Acanthoscelides obtectus]CAK1663962.1 Scaffold attachment factor B1 [Acanthoscelides obtectus]